MELLLKSCLCIMVGAISIWHILRICQRNKLREIAHDIIGRWESCFPHRLSARWLLHEVNLATKEQGLMLPRMTEGFAEEILYALYQRGVLEKHEYQYINGTCSNIYTLIPAAERR